jgi:hypothetical protein
LAAACARAAKTETLSLYEQDTHQTNLTFGRKGSNPGDLFVFSGEVFDPKSGTKLGRLGGHCETISTGAHGETRCPAVFTLAGGDIVIDGLDDSAALFGGKTVPVTVTGGIGIYRDVRGDGTVEVPKNVPSAADANFVLHLAGTASR